MRATCILLGLTLSTLGLMMLLQNREQALANFTWCAGLFLFYSGALALSRKSRRSLARTSERA